MHKNLTRVVWIFPKKTWCATWRVLPNFLPLPAAYQYSYMNISVTYRNSEGEKKNSCSLWFLFRQHWLLLWLGGQTGSGGGWKMSKSLRWMAWVDAAITHHFLIANLKLLVIYYQPIEKPTHTLPLYPIKDSKPITWLTIKPVNQIVKLLRTKLSYFAYW